MMDTFDHFIMHHHSKNKMCENVWKSWLKLCIRSGGVSSVPSAIAARSDRPQANNLWPACESAMGNILTILHHETQDSTRERYSDILFIKVQPVPIYCIYSIYLSVCLSIYWSQSISIKCSLYDCTKSLLNHTSREIIKKMIT